MRGNKALNDFVFSLDKVTTLIGELTYVISDFKGIWANFGSYFAK